MMKMVRTGNTFRGTDKEVDRFKEQEMKPAEATAMLNSNRG